MNRLGQQLRIAAGFFSYLKHSLTEERAFEQLLSRVENRDQRFLDLASTLIFSNPLSPYRKLLDYANCSFSDLATSVHSHGLETTLERLRDAGVYVTVDEFKSKEPLCRGSLRIETTPSDFDNPYFMGRSIQVHTSGSTGRKTRVLYDWNFFAEEASNELLLHALHGVARLPESFWYPGFPSISGIHNVLVHLKFRKPPERWFTHLKGSMRSRALLNGLSLLCGLFGIRVPLPETTYLEDAGRVASWMSQRRPCCLKTFTSSAVRVVQAAREMALDITGSVIFTGGEPLTPRRKDFIQSAGVSVHPRYVATETGFIGAGCNIAPNDSMHLYTDRLAAIQKKSSNVDKILFTSISSNTGKVLLNTDLGDAGRIRSGTCNCLFGKAGMDVFLEEIQNHDKLTSEGMTVLGTTMDAVVGNLIAELGGGPDHYQFWETESEQGMVKIIIAVSPEIRNLNESSFKKEVLSRIRSKGIASEIASEFWKQADALEVVRDHPRISNGYKHFPFLKKT